MGSRETDGERVRSHRIVRWIAETADGPRDPADGIVKTIAFDGTGVWPAFGHTGGMQVVGDVIAVAAMPDGRYLMIATGNDGHLVRVFESDQTDLLDSELTWQKKASWQPGLEPVDPPCWEIPLKARSPDRNSQVVTAETVGGDGVTVDADHPLAGVALTLDLTVEPAGDATEEEPTPGHAHRFELPGLFP